MRRRHLRRPRSPSVAQTESWASAAARELRENPLAPATGLVEHVPASDQVATPAAVAQSTPSPTHLLEPSVASGGSVATVTGILKYAGLALDSETGRTTYQGRSLDLTPEEFDLLNTLLHTGRRVRSKADLVLALRGARHLALRQRGRQASGRRAHRQPAPPSWATTTRSPAYIETVRGVGYRLARAPDHAG